MTWLPFFKVSAINCESLSLMAVMPRVCSLVISRFDFGQNGVAVAFIQFVKVVSSRYGGGIEIQRKEWRM